MNSAKCSRSWLYFDQILHSKIDPTMKVSHGTIVSTVIFLLTLLVIVILVRTYATGPRSLIAPKCSPLDVDFIKVRIQRCRVCKISLSFRFRISLSDMTNYKSAFGKVCRIKNRQTFKSMPILNSAYHAVKYAELRIGILLKICRFVIRHITTWYGMPN